MPLPVVGKDGTRIEQVVRIDEELEPAHHAQSLRSPFRLDKGGHVATGSMLSLQRAAMLRHHQFHELVYEGSILTDGSLVVEGLGDDEMEVTVLGVAEDDRVIVPVL